MVSIQVDENTAKQIEKRAREKNLSVPEYVRSLIPSAEPKSKPSWEEIEREILALSSAEPGLPPDFSRADIYLDHD